MSDEIKTTAEAHEAHAMPRAHAVHTDPPARPGCEDQPLPDSVTKKPVQQKSPAEWAYQRLVLYIKNFEEQLDDDHEVAFFSNTEAGVIPIEGIGYFDPDIVTFYSTDPHGQKAQQVLHVSQLNVMLRTKTKTDKKAKPRRIGFKLFADLEED